MRVLFLAEGTPRMGGARMRAVTGEIADVLARGDTAVVLVELQAKWRREPLPDGAEVAELHALRFRRLPNVLVWLVVFKAAELAFRVLGRGRLRAWTRRAEGAWWRRVVARLRRGSRLFTARPPGDDDSPLRRRIHADVRHVLIRYQLLKDATFDLVVVGDLESIPDAVRMVATRPTARLATAACYGLDMTPMSDLAGAASR